MGIMSHSHGVAVILDHGQLGQDVKGNREASAGRQAAGRHPLIQGRLHDVMTIRRYPKTKDQRREERSR
jgi:hypothetical protein